MASHRIEKINGQIQRELSLIIQQKMKDSRFNRDTLSITHVKAAPDQLSIDHLDGANGTVKALISSLCTGPFNGLLNIFSGEHAKHYRNLTV